MRLEGSNWIRRLLTLDCWRRFYFALSVLYAMNVVLTRGDGLRSAQRLPLATIFRAFGAV